MRTMTGGCACGKVRYEADVASDEAYLCHCGMCRRATGSVSIAFVELPRAQVRFLSEPDWWQSSPIARRPFCATCGTSLGFAFLEGSERMDVTVGSFDEPGYFRCTSHFAPESRLPNWHGRVVEGLPEVRAADNPGTRDRWLAATGRLPD